MQTKRINPKMGFIWRAKHGLSKHGIKKIKVGLILRGEENVKEKEKRR